MGWKKVYSCLKPKTPSRSPSGSRRTDDAVSPFVPPERTQPLVDATDDATSVSSLLDSPAKNMLGHSTVTVQQVNALLTTSVHVIAANTDSTPNIVSPAQGEIQDDVIDALASPAPETSHTEWAKVGRVAHNAATQILPIVQAVAEAVPMVGPSLKVVIGGLLKVLNALGQVEQNKINAGNLIRRLSNLESFVSHDGDDTRRPGKRELLRTLGSLRSELQSLEDVTYALRLLENQDQAQRISDHINRANESILDYVFLSGMQLTNDLELLHMRGLLNGLLRTRNAGWNSQELSACSENTRVDILEDLKHWSSDPKGPSLFWMYGLAGTGKTTIAYTFTKMLASEQRHVASFFCSRAHADRSNMAHIFPFLAYHLAMVNGEFRRGLLPALEKNPNAAYLALEYQISELLVQPLQKVHAVYPSIVVIVDALDECQDDSATSEIITLIARHSHVFSRIKFFISSRPESRIIEGFRQESLTSYTQTFILHDVNRTSVKNDIEGFLRARLGEIARRRSAEIPLNPWPPESLLRALVEKCGGLWIFASTVCALIDDPYDDPHNRLEAVASVAPNPDEYGAIDRLYNEIFNLAFNRLLNPKIVANVRKLIAAILLIFDPISVRGMSGLLELQISDIRFRLLKPLASVIILPDSDDGSIRTFHTSFHDFLTSRNRCFDARFYVDPSISHVQLALQCLRCLQQSSSDDRWSEWWKRPPPVDDIQSELGADVYYSCRYWMNHLAAGNLTISELASVETTLKQFFLETLLHWMECMALLDEVASAISSLKKMRSWLNRILGGDHPLRQLFYDNGRSSLSKLGQTFLYNTEQSGLVTEADNAITCFREALAFTPQDDSNRFRCLESLCRAFNVRFERYGPNMEDIDEAIQMHREVLRLTRSDSPRRPAYLNKLATTFAQRFTRSKSIDDFNESISVFRTSFACLSGRPIDRIHALVLSARFAHRSDDLVLACELYEQTFHVLPQLDWVGPGAVTQLERWDLDLTLLASDAAACIFALSESHFGQKQHYLSLAVELLDQGRSMWWSHTSACRRDLDDLRKHSSGLAEDLVRIGQALGADDQPDYHTLAVEWEQCVRQVRQLPEFEHFLLPLPILKLRQAAISGPVVIANISSYRRDALILQRDKDLVSVALSKEFAYRPEHRIIHNLSWQRSELKNPRARVKRDPRTAGTEGLERILRKLWLFLGEPIIRQLEIQGVRQSGTSSRPRVCWGLPPKWLHFFPIHAARPKDPLAPGMLDLFTSSYTTTLSALLHPRNFSEFHMLVVGQPESQGRLPLNNVVTEMEAIRSYISADQATFFEGSSATVNSVCNALPTCTWAHFACHGNAEKRPMSSSLIMDGEEQLGLAIIAQSVPQTGGFAFFSTCEMAPAAACLQFSGLHGAIATMWSVEDINAFAVAEEFYSELFKNGVTGVTAADAAFALNQACCFVRDNDNVPLDHWVPYVHIGGFGGPE